MGKELKIYFILGTCYNRSDKKKKVSCLISAENPYLARKQFEKITREDNYDTPFIENIKVIE